MRFYLTALALLFLSGTTLAETRMLTLRHAHPEDLERIIGRIKPEASVAAVPRQNALVITADDDVLADVERLVRELDAPNRVVELEIRLAGVTRSSARATALAAGLRRPSGTAPVSPESQLNDQGGAGTSATVQSLLATPGSPAEVTLGDEVLVNTGPANPPVSVQTGKRVRIDSLRITADPPSAEMEVTVEDRTTGALPVISSGTTAKTEVRLLVGQEQTIAAATSESSSDATEASATASKPQAQARRGRTRISSSTNELVTIRLVEIR
jgi:hypothetical protein